MADGISRIKLSKLTCYVFSLGFIFSGCQGPESPTSRNLTSGPNTGNSVALSDTTSLTPNANVGTAPIVGNTSGPAGVASTTPPSPIVAPTPTSLNSSDDPLDEIITSEMNFCEGEGDNSPSSTPAGLTASTPIVNPTTSAIASNPTPGTQSFECICSYVNGYCALGYPGGKVLALSAPGIAQSDCGPQNYCPSLASVAGAACTSWTYVDTSSSNAGSSQTIVPAIPVSNQAQAIGNIVPPQTPSFTPTTGVQNGSQLYYIGTLPAQGANTSVPSSGTNSKGYKDSFGDPVYTNQAPRFFGVLGVGNSTDVKLADVEKAIINKLPSNYFGLAQHGSKKGETQLDGMFPSFQGAFGVTPQKGNVVIAFTCWGAKSDEIRQFAINNGVSVLANRFEVRAGNNLRGQPIAGGGLGAARPFGWQLISPDGKVKQTFFLPRLNPDRITPGQVLRN